jgi:MOSC domain-containing protein YiiM
MPTIVSVQVSRVRWFGTPDAADPMDRAWSTGFFKEPVGGPVRVTPTGLNGDEQADRMNHGGPDKAVLAYSADHYPGWRTELGMPELPFGAFGENLTVSGLTEADVCVGDVWRAGEVVFEVSQPRQPCWKLARRWRVKALPAVVIRTGRSGWYLRVLTEGELAAAAEMTLEERPNPAWAISRANEVMHHQKADGELAGELARVPQLSMSWRETLTARP